MAFESWYGHTVCEPPILLPEGNNLILHTTSSPTFLVLVWPALGRRMTPQTALYWSGQLLRHHWRSHVDPLLCWEIRGGTGSTSGFVNYHSIPCISFHHVSVFHPLELRRKDRRSPGRLRDHMGFGPGAHLVLPTCENVDLCNSTSMLSVVVEATLDRQLPLGC